MRFGVSMAVIRGLGKAIADVLRCLLRHDMGASPHTPEIFKTKRKAGLIVREQACRRICDDFA